VGNPWQLDVSQVAGLVGAAVLIAVGFWALWRARHRTAGDEKVELPIVGTVGIPTCLTLGLCLLGLGYHVAAYSLLPGVVLVAVPLDRWWILVAASIVAVGSALAADRLESRDDDR
jgi:hypothetical protein